MKFSPSSDCLHCMLQFNALVNINYFPLTQQIAATSDDTFAEY